MNNIENFFTKFFSDEHPTVDNTTKMECISTADEINSNSSNCNSSLLNLNDETSIGEIERSITSFKPKKSSSADMIKNEILKNLDSRNVALLTKF